MTSRRPAAQRPKPGAAADARRLSEMDRLMRARAYIRPLPAPPPLHVMARHRGGVAGTRADEEPDGQA